MKQLYKDAWLNHRKKTESIAASVSECRFLYFSIAHFTVMDSSNIYYKKINFCRFLLS